MEAGLQQRLTADPALSAVVATRVYPLILPDTPTYPAVTYQRISTVRSYTTTGAVQLTRIRVQIDAWAEVYAQAKATAIAIRNSLECFTGTLPDGTRVDSVQLDSQFDLYEDTARTYRVSSDFLIFAVE